MNTEEFLSALEVPFSFRRRPPAIPGDLRPVWRIGFISLILHEASRGQKSSLPRLHVISWCSKSKSSRAALLRFVDGNQSSVIIVRFEPSLNRAMDLCIGEGVVERAGTRLALTERGERIAREIMNHEQLMVSEKEFLADLGKRISENMAKRLIEGEGIF